MGALFGGLLAKSGRRVCMVDYRPERAQKIRDQGLVIESARGREQIKVEATADASGAEIFDLVMIWVKAYDTEQAAADVIPLVGEESVVLTLQNGLGNVEKLSERFGKEKVIGGTTGQGATLLGPGRVRHAGVGETVIAEPSGAITPRLQQIAEILNQAGIETEVSDDLTGLIWTKLVVSCGINALGAITRLRNGELVKQPGTKRLMEMAVEEATAVAQAKGIDLLESDPVAKTVAVCQATAQNMNSMLQDVLRERRTEVAFINGAIVEEGEKAGVPTPTNAILNSLVRTIEDTYQQQIASLPGLGE